VPPPTDTTTLEFPAVRVSAQGRWVLPASTRTAPSKRRAVYDPNQVCRWLNVAVAVLGIILTAPVMLVVALLVRITSPGPVIFTQPRVGVDRRCGRGNASGGDSRRQSDRGGALFTIYKFRTMRTDPADGQVWASRNDPRITVIGKFLRATRLDELPQLFNVVRGDMNIVGPRPEQPEIFEELAQKVHGYRERQRVLPGITGWAQVNHGYDQCLDDVKRKVELDLEYIQRRSPSADLLIMAKTVPVMVLQKVWM